MRFSFFFFNDTATTEIYTLSLHDALPIFVDESGALNALELRARARRLHRQYGKLGLIVVDYLQLDRKSTRLNSSHGYISYAVFCLKKKKNDTDPAMHIQYCASRISQP